MEASGWKHSTADATSNRLEALYQRLLTTYDRSLRWTLIHRKVMLLVTLGSFIASIVAFVAVPKGFFPGGRG